MVNRSTRLANRPRRHDRLFNLAQAVLAEVHLLADEEGRRAEDTALDGGVGVGDQRLLDRRIAGQGDEAIGGQAGRGEGGGDARGINPSSHMATNTAST